MARLLRSTLESIATPCSVKAADRLQERFGADAVKQRQSGLALPCGRYYRKHQRTITTNMLILTTILVSVTQNICMMEYFE